MDGYNLPGDEPILNAAITVGSSRVGQGDLNSRSVQGDKMNKRQEKVLLATLCGLVIAAAGAFAAQPATAAGYNVDQVAKVTGVAHWDRLNVRKWPASYSRRVGALQPGSHVWVERCIETKKSSDWCLVGAQETTGWVNSRYLTIVSDRDL